MIKWEALVILFRKLLFSIISLIYHIFEYNKVIHFKNCINAIYIKVYEIKLPVSTHLIINITNSIHVLL